jgi:anti-sigma factor (TIGR02949 family)
MPDDMREIDCRSAVRQLWDYLDGELDDERMAQVQRHLESCQRCLPHETFGRRFLEALHASRLRQLMPPEVRAHVLSALGEAGFENR